MKKVVIRMKYKILIIAAAVAFSTMGCAKKNTNEPLILEGATTSSRYYSDNSFFSYDTVKKTFDANDLDFWFFVKERGIGENKKLLKTINGLVNKFSKNKNYIFYPQSGFSSEYTSDLSSDGALFFLPDAKLHEKIPVPFREVDPDMFFTAVSVNFEGKITSHIDEYISHLDRGFVAGASMCAEILGPEWKMNTTARMYIKSAGRDEKSIADALLKRRTYISFEKDTYMDFMVEGHEIGDVITTDKDVFNYVINVSHPERVIGKVELVTNDNEVVASFSNVNKTTFSARRALSLPDAYNYLYVKLYFDNGNIAFTSPVWVIKQKKVVLNNAAVQFDEDARRNTIKKVTYEVENISYSSLSRVNVVLYDGQGETISSEMMDLRGRERLVKENILELTSQEDQVIKIKLYVDGRYYAGRSVTVPGSSIKKIVIDTTHTNAYVDTMGVFKKTLDKAGFHTVFAEDRSYFSSDDILKNYALIIITSPTSVTEDAVDEIKYLYTLHRYVYNGGALLLAGNNDVHSRVSINYLNRILTILYSPVRFRLDEKNGTYPIYDMTYNFSDKYLPLFTAHNETVFDKKIFNLYLRNPVEIYGQSGAGEIPISNSYNVLPLAQFTPTTAIENRKIYDYAQYAPGVICKFGKGYICVLSGINFGDYDIDELDNKAWIMAIVDYLTKTQDK